jgi:biotin carboxyl carrier protein
MCSAQPEFFFGLNNEEKTCAICAYPWRDPPTPYILKAPQVLRTSPGLAAVRYLQKDGAQVEKGRPYAEVEAMKMIMSLNAGEPGAPPA